MDIDRVRSQLTEVRDGSFSAFEALAKQRQAIEECAGWVPRLDAAQLLEVANALADTVTALSAYAAKISTAADVVLESLPKE